MATPVPSTGATGQADTHTHTDGHGLKTLDEYGKDPEKAFS